MELFNQDTAIAVGAMAFVIRMLVELVLKLVRKDPLSQQVELMQDLRESLMLLRNTIEYENRLSAAGIKSVNENIGRLFSKTNDQHMDSLQKLADNRLTIIECNERIQKKLDANEAKQDKLLEKIRCPGT